MRNLPWKKIIMRTLWIMLGVATMVFFVMAWREKDKKRIKDIQIQIAGEETQLFINERDIKEMLKAGGHIIGAEMSSLNLSAIEKKVAGNPWVKKAEIYYTNKQVLHVLIEERIPVARIFTPGGASFYLDSTALRLPLSEKVVARVPMFTGFPSDRPVLSKPDSLLLNEVVTLGQFLNKDSLWGAQIAQVDITPQAIFELVPVIGDHIITLGKATDLEQKFLRLQTFYKQAWMQKGVRYYERIDIRYKDQVVAIKQGTAKAQIDSAKSALLIQGLMAQPALDAAAAADTVAAKAAAAIASKPAPKVAAKVEPKVPAKVVDTVQQKAKPKPVINIDNKTKIAPLNNKAKKNSKTTKKTNN
jgi:cell division protein FtsQ